MNQGKYPITIEVNNQSYSLKVAAQHSLLQVLRDQLNLTGSKECCEEGECGACTVLLDGVGGGGEWLPGDDHRRSVTGRAARPTAGGFTGARRRAGGFCIPGMIMAGKYLLETNALARLHLDGRRGGSGRSQTRPYGGRGCAT